MKDFAESTGPAYFIYEAEKVLSLGITNYTAFYSTSQRNGDCVIERKIFCVREFFFFCEYFV